MKRSQFLFVSIMVPFSLSRLGVLCVRPPVLKKFFLGLAVGTLLAMPFKDVARRREWERDRAWKRRTQARRDYERERRNRKRVEAYMLLPEPERSRKLEANERRRALNLRWGGRDY